MTRWDGMATPRQNIRLHPLDVYLLKDHLRGGPIEKPKPRVDPYKAFAWAGAFLVSALLWIVLALAVIQVIEWMDL